MSVQSSVVMKGALLALMYLFFEGACILRVSKYCILNISTVHLMMRDVKLSIQICTEYIIINFL